MSPATNSFPHSNCRQVNVRASECSLLTANQLSTSSESKANWDHDWVDLHSSSSCIYNNCGPSSISRASERIERAELESEPCELNGESGAGNTRYLPTAPSNLNLTMVNKSEADSTPLDLKSSAEPSDPAPESTWGNQRGLNISSPSITRYLDNTVDGPWNPAAAVVKSVRRTISDMDMPLPEVDARFVDKVVDAPIRDILISPDSIAPLISILGLEQDATYPQVQPDEPTERVITCTDGINIIYDRRCHSDVRGPPMPRSDGTSNWNTCRQGRSMSYDLTGLRNPHDLSRWAEHSPEDGGHGNPRA